MPPNTKEPEYSFTEEQQLEKLVAPQAAPWKYEVIYIAVVYFAYVHMSAVYGVYLSWTSAKWATLAYIYIYYVISSQGLSAGSHRLWGHNSFKAKLPLQILLMLCHTAAVQYSVLWWSAGHRLHHKYSDTDADPHNSSRGLFFAHIGWLCLKPHPDNLRRRKFIDVSDLKNNPVLAFQKKYLVPLNLIFGFALPVLVPMYFWGESLNVSWHVNILRLVLKYNSAFLINSFGHGWGDRPYDKNIIPTQNKIMSFFVFGDGFHNFHHVFPWDYRSDEHGQQLNFTALFIEFFEKIGWAYDLKRVPQELIAIRAGRTGDGSAPCVQK